VKGDDKESNAFLKMVSLSYFGAVLMYLVTIGLSLNLFGKRGQPFVLNTLSVNDQLGNVAKLMFGISVLASFPLQFLNIRQFFVEWIERLFNRKSSTTLSSFIALSVLGGVSTRCRDISVVAGFSGAIFGTSMMFVFPPIMHTYALLSKCQISRNADHQLNADSPLSMLKTTFDRKQQNLPSTTKVRITLLLNAISLVAGVSLGIIGVLNHLHLLA
jgi:hypothetical protein